MNSIKSKVSKVFLLSKQSSAVNILVLLAIAHEADRVGECNLSLHEIATKTRLSKRQVVRSIKHLEIDGEFLYEVVI